jgi:hypothetical protein
VPSAVLIVDMSNFDEIRWCVELTGGRTNQCSKTLKMVKSAYVKF